MENTLTLTSSRVDITTPEGLVAHRLDKSIPHYKDVSRERRLAWLRATILSLNAIRHQRIELDGYTPAELIGLDADTLDSYIMDSIYFSDFTFYEVQEAFRMGIVGTYGEYYGINAVSLYGFLEGYWKSPKKQKAVVQIRQARLKARQEEEEKRQRDLARMQSWGANVRTVNEKTINDFAKDMAEKKRLDEEHRAKVRAQAEAIKRGELVI